MDALLTSIRILLAAAAAGTSLGAGCATSDTGNDAPASSAVNRSDAGYGGGNGALAETTSSKDWFSGDNQNDRKDDEPLVPKTARQVAEGRGDLSYKATRDGFAYVIDNRDKRKVWEGPIDQDETLTVAPFRNVIEINGKRVKRVKDLDNKHIHRIYFERESDRGRDRDRRDRDRDRRDR